MSAAILSRFSYEPPSAHRGRRNVSTVGRTRFDGVFTCTRHPRRDVAALLPAGLRLAENLSSDPDVHPIVFLFGEHTRGAVFYVGLEFHLGIAYGELLIGVPFVVPEEGGDFHTYVPGMFCGYFPATWSGNRHYGYRKENAVLRWLGPNYVVTTPRDGVVLQALVDPRGRPAEAAEISRSSRLERMREIFEQPLLGHREDGVLIESIFRFGFDDARVADTECAIEAERPLFGIPAAPFTAEPRTTLRCEGLTWNLTWPEPYRPRSG